MSDKQKQPLPKNPPPDQQMQTDQNPAAGPRGIEPEELHRQSGHRVSDQGNRKSKSDH